MATTVTPIVSLNPATEEVLASFDPFTPDEIELALGEAHEAFLVWREQSVDGRPVHMRRLARLLRDRAERYGKLITLEMGKPINEAKAEIEKCAWACEHFAAHAAAYLADEPVRTNTRRSIVAFAPLGVVLAVMPWNFPFWQVIRFAAPALMAGNSAVLKHASNVPQCALAIEEAVRDAGFPEGLLRTVLVSGGGIEPIIADSRVRAVTLTGSSDTGSRIAELAGRALKKTVLELGGSDPFIVLADADLDAAAATGARARNQNAGQSCIAAKRFIAERAVADDFERKFAKAVEDLVVGDPLHHRVGRVRSAAALRRHQALGLRARAFGVRDPRVHERPDDLDRAGGDAAASVAAGRVTRTRLATEADAAAIARIYCAAAR